MLNLRRVIGFSVLFTLLLVAWLYFGAVITKAPGDIERFLLPLQPQTDYLTQLDFTKPTPDPLYTPPPVKLKQTAWIPDWGMQDGLNSLKQAGNVFDSVSPVWYYLNSDGSVKSKQSSLSDIRDYTRQHGIKLIPTISGFDADAMHTLLASDDSVLQHVNYLISEVEKYGYDGLDLDYESIYMKDQAQYLSLISQLHTYLHSHGKILAVDVMPQWSDQIIYDNLIQTRQVQDWTEIAPLVDELRIMVYNFTDYTSASPGPIAPLDWAQAVLRYARGKVSMSKVMLGVNLYGYDGWSENLNIAHPYLGEMSNPSSGKGEADAVTYTSVVKNFSKSVANVLDTDTYEKVLLYKQNGNTYYVTYQDAQSIALRKQLARAYGAAGLAYWRMGGEDPGVYQ